jgi:hypothetical protein
MPRSGREVEFASRLPERVINTQILVSGRPPTLGEDTVCDARVALAWPLVNRCPPPHRHRLFLNRWGNFHSEAQARAFSNLHLTTLSVVGYCSRREEDLAVSTDLALY